MGFLFALAVLILAAPMVSQAQYQAELTFDDALAGTAGPVNNLETDTGVRAALVNGAVRSALEAGRWGRAADLPAQGSVLLNGWSRGPALIVHAWLKPRGGDGVVVREDGAWALALVDGALVLRVAAEDGQLQPYPLPLSLPADRWTHLSLRGAQLSGEATFAVSLDFGPWAEAAVGALPAQAGPLRLGFRFDGLVDEVAIANKPFVVLSPEDDALNRWPTACPAGRECLEEGFTLTPRGFPHPVPLRFKTVWDPAVCGPARPCPVHIEISGGGACANDYATGADLQALTAGGLVVVTVDPYCEGAGNTSVPDSEVGQLLAAKDFALTDGHAAQLWDGSPYTAGGCSHGAEAVQAWVVNEQDHPARAFIRSAGGSGLCARAAGELCGVPADNLPDLEQDRVRQAHLRGDFVAKITAEVAGTREVARSWGVNLEGPVCTPEGQIACREEGKWGMTYASRRFRTVWERLQPADAPTGYFVEDRGEDCRHCAPVDSAAFACGLCLLKHGRAAMPTACPECLSYADPSVDPGAPADLCPLDASWYADPVAEPTPDAGPLDATVADAGPLELGVPDLSAPDGGLFDDVARDVDPPPGADGPRNTSDGCEQLPAPSALWLLPVLTATLRRRRRPR